MSKIQTTPSFAQWLQGVSGEVQQALAGALNHSSHAHAPAALRAAVEYGLLGQGKRVRPALVLLANQACGGPRENAWPAAVAVEMIHAYSLIHDDLPCMDDDSLRRGVPTVHAAHGEAMGVLAGDALQCLAFEVLAKQPDAALAARQVHLLALASGPQGMVGGQALDMQLEGQGAAASLEQVEEVHLGKTAALLATSVLLGVSAAGGAIDDWRLYANRIGRLFQATDDLLDVTASTQSLGKTAGKDQAAEKATLVASLGLQGATEYAQQLAAQAVDALRELPLAAGESELQTLPDFLLQRCR
jgi:geranylgeranyl pyrophosphate synthase